MLAEVYVQDFIERNKAKWFVRHIEKHLNKGEQGDKAKDITPGVVGCTICGKDIDEIALDYVRQIIELAKKIQERDDLKESR